MSPSPRNSFETFSCSTISWPRCVSRSAPITSTIAEFPRLRYTLLSLVSLRQLLDQRCAIVPHPLSDRLHRQVRAQIQRGQPENHGHLRGSADGHQSATHAGSGEGASGSGRRCSSGRFICSTGSWERHQFDEWCCRIVDEYGPPVIWYGCLES